MSVWFKRILPSLAILGLLVTAAATAQERPAAPNAAPIRLQAGTFTPGLGEAPELPPGLEIADYAAGTAGDYIVQFDGPVGQAQRDTLAGLGARVLGYLPDFAFKVRMTPEQADVADALAGVAWTGLFHPAYKLSPRLQRNGPRLYRVMLERGADAEATADDITGTGAQMIRRGGNVAVISAMGAQLDAIAHIMDVAWIENYAFREKHNFYARGILGADVVNSTIGQDTEYNGSTQTVAVADTGLDDGSGVHPDLPAGRVTIYNWQANDSPTCYTVNGDGAQDVDSGHGTHVAVSIGGEGTEPGTAPAAHIIFQAVEDWIRTKRFCNSSPNGYYLIGLPADLRTLFDQAYTAGARVHSNSWGSAAAGAYTADSANTDDFVWNNPDLTITFSAGNSGPAGGSIGSPATAKNVITVGASENYRNGDYACDPNLEQTERADATCTGGQNGAGDLADNLEQMADFSSLGPTDDGRIKPDVVAPGTWVLSGYSGMYQTSLNPRNNLPQWNGAGVPPDSVHKYMFGTSMSNPLVAGAAAVVRDYYQKEDRHAASAALVKATLINTAVDMLDENYDGVDDNDFPIPNNYEGWGRVDLAAATAGHDYVDDYVGDDVGVANGQTEIHTVTVAPGGGPLRITLVWSDAPAMAGALTTLVNNLDLVVTAPLPGETIYLGNAFSEGWSATGGAADTVNNVENVYISSADISSADDGDWTVKVVGTNVPNDPQPYALVVDGGSLGEPVADETAPTPDPMTWANGGEPLATGAFTIEMMATIASDDSGSVEYFFDYCESGGVNCDNSGWQPSTSYTAENLIPDTTYDFQVKARDLSLNETAFSTPLASATTDPDNTVPTPDPMTWASVPAATGTTTIEMTAATASDDSGSVEYFFDYCESGGVNCGNSGWQTSTSYTAANLNPDTTYDFQVKARDLSLNETAFSTPLASATTDSAGDPPAGITVSVVTPITCVMRGGKDGKKHVDIPVTVVDGAGLPVGDATVTVEVFLGLINPVSIWSGSGLTIADDGTVIFGFKNADSGDYVTVVTDVTGSGLVWDDLAPSTDLNSCKK